MTDHRTPAPTFSTADLYDAQPDVVQVLDLQFRAFGRPARFHGPIETVRVFEDHAPVRDIVGEPGSGRVLLVDSGGSLRIGVAGDRIASKAMANGWAGLVVVGAIRDGEVLDGLAIGVRALGSTARRSDAGRPGLRGVPLLVGGVLCRPGDFLYADRDAVIVSASPLDLGTSDAAPAP